MEIGVSLPTMAAGYDRSTTLQWCAGIDAGPFSSISCGERITFRNPEMMVTMASAAALTERARVFVNLVVAPMHPPALVAKQIATLDVLSAGRVTLAVGVGGREHDYRALGAPYENRHSRLDAAVAEIRALWAGRAPFDGADAVEPVPAQKDRIPVLAGAMGPKGLARAAGWADGISGFTLTAERAEMEAATEAARNAWSGAGREVPPRIVSGCFYEVGLADSAERLRRFTYEYLEIFGSELAELIADASPVHSPERLVQVLDDAAAAGCDEFILVPADVDPACLELTTEVVSDWLS